MTSGHYERMVESLGKASNRLAERSANLGEHIGAHLAKVQHLEEMAKQANTKGKDNDTDPR